MKIELNIRLNLLEYIKSLFTTINTNDLLLLIVYKTNAILDTYNLNIKNVSLDDMSSEEKRIGMFHSIYSSLGTKFGCIGLINLLKIWPAFENIIEINSKPWNLVFIRYIKLVGEEEGFDLIELIRELKNINC
jgi:hypothetical protein